jgi:hypothetical protein
MATKKPLFIIDEQQPGSILKDFSTLLAFIGEGKYLVSQKLLNFPPLALNDLNQRMTKPIQHGFIRPTQTTFPHIDLMYQVMRRLGFLSYQPKRKNKKLYLNNNALTIWKKLNVTEQYFELLNACLSYAPESVSIAQSVRNLNQKYASKGQISISKSERRDFKYMLRFYGLAFLELFGLYKIEQGKPEKKTGWKVMSLEATPQGKAIFPYFDTLELDSSPNEAMEAFFSTVTNSTPVVIKKTVYEMFSPFFPAYKQKYIPPATKAISIEGNYIFKISLHKCWRRIEIPHTMTLSQLGHAILYYFDFQNDHLHEFSCRDKTGKTITYPHYAAIGGGANEACASDKIILSKLMLEPGMNMTFWFDFGDSWIFDVFLEELKPSLEIDNPYGKLLGSKSEAPEQYSQWDSE